MVEKGLLTFASFMIIYSNKNVLHQLVLYSANIFEIVADTKFYSKRIFELYDENKFKIEKFGNVKIEKVVGKIEFRNVSYGYIYERNKENNDLTINQIPSILDNIIIVPFLFTINIIPRRIFIHPLKRTLPNTIKLLLLIKE